MPTASPNTELEALPQVWERLPDESARNFASFKIYRDLPVEVRSIARAAEIAWEKRPAKSRGQLDTTVRRFERLASEHLWKARGDQWDDYRNRVEVIEEIAARRKLGKKHAQLAEKLVDTALAALGKLKVETMSAHEIARMADVGVKLGRLIAGETTGDQIPTGESLDPQDSIVELLASDPEVAKAGAKFGAQVLRSQREREEAREREG